MYVDVNEICEDWGVSRTQGYKMIKLLNERMLLLNPNLIVLSGKINRRFIRSEVLLRRETPLNMKESFC